MAILYQQAYLAVQTALIPGIVYDSLRFQAGSVYGASFIPNILNPINQTYQQLAVDLTGLTPVLNTDSGTTIATYALTRAQLQSRII